MNGDDRMKLTILLTVVALLAASAADASLTCEKLFERQSIDLTHAAKRFLSHYSELTDLDLLINSFHAFTSCVCIIPRSYVTIAGSLNNGPTACA